MLNKLKILAIFVSISVSKAQIYCQLDKSNKTISVEGTLNIIGCNATDLKLGDLKKSIKFLDAGQNLLESLEDHHLKDAINLERIILLRNKIKKVSCRAFECQEKLIELNLEQNELKRLTPGVFDYLISLETLILTDNQLAVVEKDLFKNNTKLVEVYLNSNIIFAMDAQVFEYVNQSLALFLGENECNKVESLINFTESLFTVILALKTTII